MATPSTRRRITPDMSPSERRRAVREMLRELGLVLAAARRANREIPWPAAPTAPAAEAARAATAV